MKKIFAGRSAAAVAGAGVRAARRGGARAPAHAGALARAEQARQGQYLQYLCIISTISIQGPVRHRALGQHPAGDGGSVRQVSGCKHYFKNKI